jgi:hypothetical protein
MRLRLLLCTLRQLLLVFTPRPAQAPASGPCLRLLLLLVKLLLLLLLLRLAAAGAPLYCQLRKGTTLRGVAPVMRWLPVHQVRMVQRRPGRCRMLLLAGQHCLCKQLKVGCSLLLCVGRPVARCCSALSWESPQVAAVATAAACACCRGHPQI